MMFTQGVWKVTDTAFAQYTSHRGSTTGARTFVTVDYNQVAEVHAPTQAEAEANARLIAASPTMYAALKLAQEGKGDWRGAIDDAILDAEQGVGI